MLDDDYIRECALEIAPDEQLVGFIQAVNGVGKENIVRLSLEMVEDKTNADEGYEEGHILLILLELAESAEFLLRTRNP